MNSSNILIYTTQTCQFCIRAKALLDNKGWVYDEISVDDNPELRQEMIEKAGQTSVPQIWIQGHHIGGCYELQTLESSGKLDAFLETKA